MFQFRFVGPIINKTQTFKDVINIKFKYSIEFKWNLKSTAFNNIKIRFNPVGKNTYTDNLITDEIIYKKIYFQYFKSRYFEH